MKGRLNLELAVGAFMIVGILCLGYLSIKLGKIEVLGKSGYEVFAVFNDVGGLTRIFHTLSCRNGIFSGNMLAFSMI